MYIKIKRVIDFVGAILLLIITSIPMGIIALMIKIEDGSPVLFKQKRSGKDGKAFYIYKFRTMITERKQLESELTHEQMVTKVGKILRRTSLDELPQLFNIIKGDMSFIGPRPWIEDYNFWFNDEQKKRNNVLPGISGLAQTKGRNAINIFTKIDYDLEYVANISFLLDIKIIWWTIKTLFNKEESEITENGIKHELEELKSMNHKLHVS